MDSQDESILSELSPETNQKLEKFQDILSILSTISEREIESTYSSLNSLKVFENEFFTIYTIRKMIIFCEIYPFHINLYAKLAKLINNNSKIFKDTFLKHLFHRHYFAIECAESNFVLYTLYCCIKEEIYTNEEIITYFKTIFRQKYQYVDSNAVFFIYFSPELKEIDHDFYEELNEYVMIHISMRDSISESFKNYFFNEYQPCLIKNDFELLKKYRDNYHLSENPLFEIIYNDDVVKLREFLANPSKSCNEIIVHSIISPYREIANNLSLISTAAVFSAVNCFKYLLLNGSKIDEVSAEMGSLAQDTIVGGNIEIIRFAQQNRIDFSGALTTCAFYFRNEIFEWIFESQENNVNELTKISPAGSTVFCQASRVGNIEILLKCIEMGVDLNARDIDSFSISQAALGGNDEVVDILLSLGIHSKDKKNEQEQNQMNSLNENNIDQSNSNKGNESNSNNENKSNSNNETKSTLNDENNLNSNVIVIDKSDEDIGFGEDIYTSFPQVFPCLDIDSKIDAESIIFSMRGAVSEGQLDCLKIFFNHGLFCDISLITCAIINSRYETLCYLFEKIDFELDPNNEKIITMIVKSEFLNKNEGENQQNEKTIKIIYSKNTLYHHLFLFLTQQNDLNIVQSVFQKFHIDIDNKNHMSLVLMPEIFDEIDTFSFLFIHFSEKDQLLLLRIIPNASLKVIMAKSIYKKEFLNFFVGFKKNNDLSKLHPNIQLCFQTAKLFLNKE